LALRAHCVETVAARKYHGFSGTYDGVIGDAVRNFIDAFGAFSEARISGRSR
jgi:hypothetical protein